MSALAILPFALSSVHAVELGPAGASNAHSGLSSAVARALSPSPPKIIVKYLSQGEYALHECAERLSSRGESFARHTQDVSDSLDRLHARFGLGRHHAIFRRPSGSSFESERSRLADRLERARNRRSRGRAGRPRRGSLPDLSHVYRVAVPEDQSLTDVLEAMRADPHVVYAQRDHALDLDQLAPPFDDPFLASEGSWGQPYADLWGLDQIRAREAWLTTLGEGVVVAVVDTGLDRFHPDIAENVWVNPGEDLNGDGFAGPDDLNGLDDDANGFIDDLTGFDFAESMDADEDGFYDGPEDVSDPDPFDDRGHGTHVSGTIAAVADNGIGIVGVAPRARIMALKGFPLEGSAEDSVLWRAVLYAAENGAAVVNNSWSCSVPCPVNPLAEEVLEIVRALGTVVVTSAGNASQDVIFRVPENGDDVLTIGAIGQNEQLADFTNRGWGIDVVAPGGGPNQPFSVRVARRNILSLLTSALDPDDEIFAVEGPYWRLAGTSMSSPHVAGSVALLRSLRPDLSPEEIRRLVRMSARDLGLPGHDPSYGAGLLDVPALLTAELPDLELRIDGPAPGSLHDPAKGPVRLLGVASGGDLERVEFAVARGLSGRAFAPLEKAPLENAPLEQASLKNAHPQNVALEDVRLAQFDRANRSANTPRNASDVLAVWDISDVPNGPHVLRMRAELFDGTIVDEYLVLGVERATPVRASKGDLRVGTPTLSGRRIVWPEVESDDPGALFDLADGVFLADRARRYSDKVPIGPRSQSLLEREGNQDDVSLDRRTLVWREREGSDTALEWCRLRGRAPRAREGVRDEEAPPGRCDPRAIELAPGFVSAPIAAGGWIVWQRDDVQVRAIEGCRIGSADRECIARSLIRDDASTRWTLRSFDGRTLLLQGGGRLVLCTVRADGAPCVPEEIFQSPGTPSPTEPVHDGRLLAFREVTLELLPAPGCLPGEFIAECIPSLAVVVRYRACEIDVANVCDSVPISRAARVENTAGLAVDGRRIVWSMASEVEEVSIRFCEFQPSISASSGGECVEQRLSGSLARQDGIAIDGHRLVWRDGRAGQLAIFSYALPDLAGRRGVRARAGRPFSIPLRARRGTASSLDYVIEAVEGLDPALANAKIYDPGFPGGRIFLRGVLPRDAAGSHRWRVRAQTGSGLFSTWTVEIKAAFPSDTDTDRYRASINGVARNQERTRRAPRRSGRGPEKARTPGR